MKRNPTARGGASGGRYHDIQSAKLRLYALGARVSALTMDHDVGDTERVVNDDDLRREEEDAVGHAHRIRRRRGQTLESANHVIAEVANHAGRKRRNVGKRFGLRQDGAKRLQELPAVEKRFARRGLFDRDLPGRTAVDQAGPPAEERETIAARLPKRFAQEGVRLARVQALETLERVRSGFEAQVRGVHATSAGSGSASGTYRPRPLIMSPKSCRFRD